jgi:serine/threonine protein phosphatase 1
MFSTRKKAQAPAGRRIYAVGDIHARADLLAILLRSIEDDARETARDRDPPVLVFTGDYIDRGLQARETIDLVLRLSDEDWELRFLKGNHEAALLRFLDAPQTGPDWFRLGGAETLFSYGLAAPGDLADPFVLNRTRDALRMAMPSSHMRFFHRLELFARYADYVFVHAGLRPGRSLEQQDEADMLSIRDPFIRSSASWPFVVVHGHTPTACVHHDHRRIGIDTGAYATRRLSAVRLEGAAVDILST